MPVVSNPATVPHIWRPSTARVVVLDSYVPTARGTAGGSVPLAWPAKDPADVLDYQFDISPALTGNDGDAIATLDVVISPSEAGGLALASAAADGARAVLWLGQGVSGTTYNVTFTLATQAGRTLARSVQLPVAALSVGPDPINSLVTDGGGTLTDQNGNPLVLGG